jgi:tubulin monoglycylase TTLL3/8
VLLENLKKLNPQFDLNGDRNNWVIKPAGLSRGRGIKFFDDLKKLLDYIVGKSILGNLQWVA